MWKQKETGKDYNPYYYEMDCGIVELELSGGYKTDPYTIRIYKDGITICKEYFHAEDLEAAKDAALNMCLQISQQHVAYWNQILEAIKSKK